VEETRELAAVTTSASQLHRVLSKVADPKETTRLGGAIMRAIGNADGHPSEAFKLLNDLIDNVSDDLNASFDGDLLSHLSRQFSPFLKLKEFTPYDQTVNRLVQDGNSPLSQTKIQGKCERPNLEINEDIVRSINELRTKLGSLQFPEHIERIFNNRIDQLERALREFSLFGISGINNAIEELMGAMELYPSQRKKASESFRDFAVNVATTVMVIVGAISTTNNTIEEGQKLLENYRAGTGFIEDLRKKRAPSDGEKSALDVLTGEEE
jgi:hypothetical protein